MREKIIVDKHWIVAVPPNPAPSSSGIIHPGVRRVKDLAPVLLEPKDSEEAAYWMYRGFGHLGEHLRLDLTIMRSGKIGKEYVKTFGHVHPSSPWAESYGEVYEIVEGEALMIIQRDNVVKLFKLRKNETVYIPPGWGHVTVNIGKEMLRMINIVASDFKSDYEPYKRMRGAAVYVTEDGIIPNKAYLSKHKEIKVMFCRSLSPPLEWWIRHLHLLRCLRTGACSLELEICDREVRVTEKERDRVIQV